MSLVGQISPKPSRRDRATPAGHDRMGEAKTSPGFAVMSLLAESGLIRFELLESANAIWSSSRGT